MIKASNIHRGIYRMKKVIAITLAVLMFCVNAAVVAVADTADIVKQSVEGTAVIDGTKDEAYADALTLEIKQKGMFNGDGSLLDEPEGVVYIINDAEFVYMYVDVLDDNLDNANTNNYAKDSVEVFWMVDNEKAQIRYHYDGTVDEDSGVNVESATVLTDTGYAVETKIPITDVYDNKLEICVQINCCENGSRLYTCFIDGNADGDDAWQRSNRESVYDCWWTLELAGEFEDTYTKEFSIKPTDNLYPVADDDYYGLMSIPLAVSASSQSRVDWTSVSFGDSYVMYLGDTIEVSWTDTKLLANWTDTSTNNFSVTPKLTLNFADNGILAEGIAEGSEVGTAGYVGYYSFSYGDVTFTSEGYEDVVIPGDSIENFKLTSRQEDGWVSGGTYDHDFASDIRDTLGLNIEQLCDYIYNLTSISTTVTFDGYNNIPAETVAAMQADAEAKDAELVTMVAEKKAAIEAAAAIIADEAAELADKEAALADAAAAADEAVTAAGNYPLAAEAAAELPAMVEELTATVTELQEAAAAEPEVTEPAEEEPEAETEEPEEEPEAEVTEPVAEEETDESSSGSSTTVIIIVVVVVVIAIIAVVAVLGKKKKA